MKRWTDFTPGEQAALVHRETYGYIHSLCEVGPNWLPPDLQPNFTKAVADMERMHTPWFLAERLAEDPALLAWALEQAEEYVKDAIYLEDGEYALNPPDMKGAQE